MLAKYWCADAVYSIFIYSIFFIKTAYIFQLFAIRKLLDDPPWLLYS